VYEIQLMVHNKQTHEKRGIRVDVARRDDVASTAVDLAGMVAVTMKEEDTF